MCIYIYIYIGAGLSVVLNHGLIVLTTCVACFRQNPSTVDGCSWHLKEQTLTILCTDHGFVLLHCIWIIMQLCAFYLANSFRQKCLRKTIFRNVSECAVQSSLVVTCINRANIMEVQVHISHQNIYIDR